MNIDLKGLFVCFLFCCWRGILAWPALEFVEAKICRDVGLIGGQSPNWDDAISVGFCVGLQISKINNLWKLCSLVINEASVPLLCSPECIDGGILCCCRWIILGTSLSFVSAFALLLRWCCLRLLLERSNISRFVLLICNIRLHLPVWGGGGVLLQTCQNKDLFEGRFNLQETLQAKALARNNRASGHLNKKAKRWSCHRYQLLWLVNDSTDSDAVPDVVVVAASMASPPPPPPPLGDDGASDAESILGDWGSVLASAGAGGVMVGKGFLIPRLIAIQKKKNSIRSEAIDQCSIDAR